MKGEWRWDFTALIPGLGELKTRMCGFRKWEPLYTFRTDSTVQLYKILGLYLQCINTVVWAKQMTHRIAGDRLHIPWVLPIASSLRRSLTLCKDKSKQPQTLPLKEDFRQLPGQVTGQVFQTTWRQRDIPQCKLLIKQSKVHKELKATKVPEISQAQLVYKSELNQNETDINQSTQASECARHKA